MKKLVVIALTLILFSGLSFAASADIHNNGTIVNGDRQGTPASGDFVCTFESPTHVTYFWQFTFVDSSDNYHSRPLYIGDANADDGYFSAIQSATGDANIVLHYSNDDRTKWVAITPTDLDAVSTTMVADTLGRLDGANDLTFHQARWLVVECASGSSTNQDDNIMYVTVRLKKKQPTAMYNDQFVRFAKVATSSKTDP